MRPRKITKRAVWKPMPRSEFLIAFRMAQAAEAARAALMGLF